MPLKVKLPAMLPVAPANKFITTFPSAAFPPIVTDEVASTTKSSPVPPIKEIVALPPPAAGLVKITVALFWKINFDDESEETDTFSNFNNEYSHYAYKMYNDETNNIETSEENYDDYYENIDDDYSEGIDDYYEEYNN